jgi:hypothetical protein
MSTPLPPAAVIHSYPLLSPSFLRRRQAYDLHGALDLHGTRAGQQDDVMASPLQAPPPHLPRELHRGGGPGEAL